MRLTGNDSGMAASIRSHISEHRTHIEAPAPPAILRMTRDLRWLGHDAWRKLRDALIDFAADSRFDNDWAADIYDRARRRGKRHPHAVRILARAWVYVIWRCSRDGVPYDPERHQALQRLTLARAA
jgi:hypothetical protein